MNFLFLALSFIALIGYTGCSGKVQTNPEPNPTKYTLPNKEYDLTSQVDKAIIEDYTAYAEEFFKKHKVEYNKSIWTIGIERGHYE